MTTAPIRLEEVFNASEARVWRALTQDRLMKQWYFDLPGFQAEKGYKFQFYGGPSPEKQYLHLCEVTDVIPGRKLAYTWRYDGYEGNSLLIFELLPEGNKTRLRLTHEDLDTFPSDNPDFAASNFEGGWNAIIHDSLKNFIEKKNYTNSFIADSFDEDVFNCLTLRIHEWWSTHFEGQAKNVNDVFTVRFGTAFQTIRVDNLQPNKKIVWVVEDALTHDTSPGNRKELIGSDIIWEIHHENTKSHVTITHEGLSPELECYEVCQSDWNKCIVSLQSLLETGTGKPYNY